MLVFNTCLALIPLANDAGTGWRQAGLMSACIRLCVVPVTPSPGRHPRAIHVIAYCKYSFLDISRYKGCSYGRRINSPPQRNSLYVVNSEASVCCSNSARALTAVSRIGSANNSIMEESLAFASFFIPSSSRRVFMFDSDSEQQQHFIQIAPTTITSRRRQ